MSPRQLELALKRQRLEFEAAAQRRELADSVRPFQPVVSAVDRVNRGLRYLKGHPEIAAVATVLVFILRPGKAFNWARRGFSAWRLWGKLNRRLHGS
ncbi:MAG: YqjK-like family protein [Rhodocyclaceae bacterium]|nr:YqjK-like family protein [Rhodocyclaceae bacterium]